MQISYTKLAEDVWGIRSMEPLQTGQQVTVTKRNGDTKTETVGEPSGRDTYKHLTTFYYTIQKTQCSRPAAQVEEQGIYVVDGNIIKMKLSQAGRLYAMLLVEIGGVRATDAGERVNYDWKYAPELTSQVLPEHKMGMEQAKFFGIRYGRCLRCGRHLKDAKSVEAAIGPVCREFFERGA